MSGYEEMQINYGNNDIKSQTGGVQLNFITRRGGNKFSGVFDLSAETKDWQSKNIPADLEARGYKGAGVNKIYLYSANFGGPIIKDKAWFYGSYGIQDIGTTLLAGASDNTWLASGYLKLDAQISSNTRVSGFYEHDNKLNWGRTNWGPTLQAPETVWNVSRSYAHGQGRDRANVRQPLPERQGHLCPITATSSSPFLGRERPTEAGRTSQARYYPDEWHWGNISDCGTVRPMFNANFNGNYFAEGLLGADHEIKFGVDYVQSTVSTYSLAEANLSITYIAPGWTEAWLLRDYKINQSFNRISGFVQDTMTFGRLAVNIGLRYDVETSKIKDELQPASPWLPQYLAKMEITEYDPGHPFKSPLAALQPDLRHFRQRQGRHQAEPGPLRGPDRLRIRQLPEPGALGRDRPALGGPERRRPGHGQRALRHGLGYRRADAAPDRSQRLVLVRRLRPGQSDQGRDPQQDMIPTTRPRASMRSRSPMKKSSWPTLPSALKVFTRRDTSTLGTKA